MSDISINLVRCANGIMISPKEGSRPHEMIIVSYYDELIKLLEPLMGKDLSKPFISGKDNKPEPTPAEDQLWFCKSGAADKCLSKDGSPNGHARNTCKNCGLSKVFKDNIEDLEKAAKEITESSKGVIDDAASPGRDDWRCFYAIKPHGLCRHINSYLNIICNGCGASRFESVEIDPLTQAPDDKWDCRRPACQAMKKETGLIFYENTNANRCGRCDRIRHKRYSKDIK